MSMFSKVATTVTLFASTVLANVVAVNGCDNLPSPPTVSSCWNCFQSLLADCDAKNKEADRRKACYEGANNFFTWCLGKAGGPRALSVLDSDTLTLGKGYSYTIVTNEEKSTNIVVYGLTETKGETSLSILKAYVLSSGDGKFDILIDEESLQTDDDQIVGIVTTVQDQTNHIVAAHASVVRLLIDGDLNADGLVNDYDCALAWDLYSRSEMSYDEFLRVMKVIGSR